MDTHDRPGPISESCADEISGLIAALAWEVENVQADKLQALQEAFGSDRQAEASALASLHLAADAFATGRVLVVERINEDWRFRAPGHWLSKPPFAATAPRRSSHNCDRPPKHGQTSETAYRGYSRLTHL